MLREQPVDVWGFKHCFDRARLSASPDQGAVGAFTENQIECANEDRFARACFPRNNIQPALQFEREVLHQGEIFYPERRQHAKFVRAA